MKHDLKSKPADEFASYRGTTVLVTGCNGFIGSALATLLTEAGASVIGITRTEPATDCVPGVKWQQGDLARRETWERALEPQVDVVFHCAAQTSAYVANDSPLEDLEQNVGTIIHLLETCRQREIRPFVVLASTITIAGLAQTPVINEDTPDAPLTVYDLHKLFAEQYLESYVARSLARGTCLRLANVYGPGPGAGSTDRGVLNRMVRLAQQGTPLTVYAPGDFVRDYVHIDDVAMAFLRAAVRSDATNGRHYLIGTGSGHTLLEAARLVAELVGLKTGTRVEVELVPPPHPQSPIEARCYTVDSSSFSHATGWRPTFDLAQGIESMLEEIA